MPLDFLISFNLIKTPLDIIVTICYDKNVTFCYSLLIGGIQLKDMQPLESILPKDILTSKTDKNRSMDEQPFVFGETTIKGKVLDYNERMHQYVNITSFNPLIGNNGYVFIQLKPDGSFEHKLNVLGTSIVWVHYAGSATTAEIFAAPKQTSEVYFNIREAARKMSDIHAETAPLGKEFYYKGPLSTVVYELSEAKKLLREEYKVYDFKKTPEKLLEEYKTKLQNHTGEILELIFRKYKHRALKHGVATCDTSAIFALLFPEIFEIRPTYGFIKYFDHLDTGVCLFDFNKNPNMNVVTNVNIKKYKKHYFKLLSNLP